MAAHLTERIRDWPIPGMPVSDWEERVASPFRAFTRRNLRTRPLLHRLLIPSNWLRPSAAVEALARCYQAVTQLWLTELPERPRFVFCATDIVFGVSWVFSKDRVGYYQAGYLREVPPWPLAQAVAASSCFPPVFDPMILHFRPEHLTRGMATKREDYGELIADLALTDGGVYDNMVLVYDGGATFTVDPAQTWFRRLLRYTAIIVNQSRSLHKRWLYAGFKRASAQARIGGLGDRAQGPGRDPACNTPVTWWRM